MGCQGGAISPPKFWGWSVRSHLFYSVSGGRPLNLGGEIVTPKFRGSGMTGEAIF